MYTTRTVPFVYNERKNMDKQTATKADQRTVPDPLGWFFIVILLGIFIAMKFNVCGMSVFISYWIVMFLLFLTELILLLKKEWRKSLYIFFVVAIMSLCFYALGIQIPPMYREILDHYSESISESKRANAFICEYVYSSSDNNRNIKIKEAFAEYRHWYKNTNSNIFTIDKNNSMFIVKIANYEELKDNGYGDDWTIEKFDNDHIVKPIKLDNVIYI